jgi:hypothetical protein
VREDKRKEGRKTVRRKGEKIGHILSDLKAYALYTSCKRPNMSKWHQLCVLFFHSWGGMRLSPLGSSATSGPILPAPE